MSAASKNASKKPKPRAEKPAATKAAGKNESRPFSAEHWKAGRRFAEEYQIIVSHEDGEWYGRGLELPGVMGDGATAEACIDKTREALAVAAAFLLEQGKTPPAPARQGFRTQQVNVRLTPEEKALLESTARNKGYNGLSDFIRAVALEAVR